MGFKRIHRLKYSWINSKNAPVSVAGSVTGATSWDIARSGVLDCEAGAERCMQNDGDVVSVILLYLCPMPANDTKTSNTVLSSIPGDGRAPVCVSGVQYVAGN